MKRILFKEKFIAVLLLTITIAGYGQKKPETSKDIKDVVKKHSSVALLPFTFTEKEYKTLPDGVTKEMVAKAEKEKGLSMQQYLFEKLNKKAGKYPYQWKSIEEVNKNIDSEKSYSQLAKSMGVDAIVSSVIETPKIILPDDKGGETMGDKSNIYGLSGSGTYVVMSIYTPSSEEPIWKWRIKLNGTFKNTKLMVNTISKNYLSEKFPYKF